MKNKLSSLVVTGALASIMPLSMAQAEPKVYGKLHLNYGTYEETSGSTTVEDNWQLNSYASRFGVKGSHDLDGGLQAVYKLEWEVNPDSDNSQGEINVEDGSAADNSDVVTVEDSGTAGFSRRNMYVGLKGGFGEVRFGRHDTPLKMVQGKFDQFGDTLGDLKNAGDEDGENRLDNVLAYLGNTGDISFALALIPSEGDGTAAGDGPADSYSASVSYASGPLYVGVAMDSYDDTASAVQENSLARLVATYKMSGMQFGLLWQSGVEKPRTSSDDKEDWLGLSFNTKFGGKNKFKAQYIMVEDSAATALEGTLLALGVDHKLNKKHKVYVMYSALEEEAGGTTTKEVNSLSLGIVSKF